MPELEQDLPQGRHRRDAEPLGDGDDRLAGPARREHLGPVTERPHPARLGLEGDLHVPDRDEPRAAHRDVVLTAKARGLGGELFAIFGARRAEAARLADQVAHKLQALGDHFFRVAAGGRAVPLDLAVAFSGAPPARPAQSLVACGVACGGVAGAPTGHGARDERGKDNEDDEGDGDGGHYGR